MWPDDRKLSGALLLFIVAISTVVVVYFGGYDWAFDWALSSIANKENIVLESITKGPFEFPLLGQQYVLTEVFSLGTIQDKETYSIAWMLLIWLGMTGFLAISSFWKRYAFLIVCGAFLLLINQSYLDTLSLFGSKSWKWASLLLMASLIVPSYYFHAFRQRSQFLNRWLVIFILSTAVLILFQSRESEFYLHFSAYTVYGVGIGSMLFIFLISEEIIFTILQLITRSKGSRGNHLHFMIFSALYVGYLLVYFLNRRGVIPGNWDILNPFYLLIASSIVSLFTIRFKQSLTDGWYLRLVDIRWLFLVLGFICFGTLGLGMMRGNDAILDGISYMTIYAHIGFGLFFTLYIIFNFITPLVQGLMVYKIAYTQHNFPYFTARLSGFVAVIALFLYTEQLPLRKFQGAKLNYEGDFHLLTNPDLANEYYKQSAVFAYDNQYASVRTGVYATQNAEIEEAIYRFTRATTKNASPYAFIAASNSLIELDEKSRAISLLRKGQLTFPNSSEIKNNLAMLLNETGASQEATALLAEAGETEGWNQATYINQLALGLVTDGLEPSQLNIAGQSNYLTVPSEVDQQALTFDSSVLKGPLNLHKLSYLVNSGWTLNRSIEDSVFRSIVMQVTQPEQGKNLMHAQAYNLYKQGRHNESIAWLNQLILSVTSYEKGFYYNQLGILYLAMDAPLLAAENFTEAMTYGSEDAGLGLAVSQMESQDWQNAEATWRFVIRGDSSYGPMLSQLKRFLDQPNSESFADLYYLTPSKPAIYQKMVPIFPKEQAAILWDKLFSEWATTQNDGTLDELYPLFQQTLSTDQQQKFDRYKAAQFAPTEITLTESKMSAFEAWKVLAVAKNDSVTIDDRYDLLVSAISINKYHAGLIKAYVFAAAEIGLFAYAEQTLLRLLTLVPPEEYQLIERELFDYKEARQASLDRWGETTD
ncbi:MAG: hypothetical protein ACI8QD_000322 [Cyclobacteriaceae bacterium]|jgi:hypothetical protein